jgi:ABC-type glycerol-3-phosphate transport system substrate-binding protein
MGIFKQTKNVELCEDLIRWIEDEKRFDEFRNVSVGQAGPVYKVRAENPYWKSDPNFEGMMQNVLRGVWIGYPGPVTAAAVEVQAQYILCDMAGRVVVGGLSPEAALKEAHARVEEIYKIRSRA